MYSSKVFCLFIQGLYHCATNSDPCTINTNLGWINIKRWMNKFSTCRKTLLGGFRSFLSTVTLQLPSPATNARRGGVADVSCFIEVDHSISFTSMNTIHLNPHKLEASGVTNQTYVYHNTSTIHTITHHTFFFKLKRNTLHNTHTIIFWKLWTKLRNELCNCIGFKLGYDRQETLKTILRFKKPHRPFKALKDHFRSSYWAWCSLVVVW